MFIIDDLLAAKAAGKILPVLIGAGAAIALGFAGAETYEHKVPWGLAHKRDAAVAERDKARLDAHDWSARFAAEQQAFRDSERLRTDDQAQARHAVEAEATACDVRVAAARRSALAIHALVTKEPTYDADRCPVRSLLDPVQLRDSLQGPAAPAPDH